MFNGYTAVKTKEHFFNIRNNPSGKYYLSSDIIIEDSDFISHGDYYNNGNLFVAMDSFNGVLDGCGHTISGLVGDYGIVSSNSGTIKNINIDNVNLTAEGISLQSANNRVVGVGIYTLPIKTNYNIGIGEQLNPKA